MAGYSGTPLVKKLGIKEGSAIHIINAPRGYRALLKPLPAAVRFEPAISDATILVHVFETECERLATTLRALRKQLAADATVWVSWPKKASKISTTVTEHTIREVALPLGFVDVKVCAVTDIWSGLKLVVRKELR
ncbi:MAG: DUF3052 domain-containing protein [Steroidobacteraceae bacterium]|jgi:bifunctional DNA-binding transcriptional regulator/antitoxin component of YhaV-PrlF toxin-antitoxin module